MSLLESARNGKRIISNAVTSLSNMESLFLYPFYQRGWVPSCPGSAVLSGLCVSGGLMWASQQMHHMQPASWAWSYAGGWKSKKEIELKCPYPQRKSPSRWSLFKVPVKDDGPGVSTWEVLFALENWMLKFYHAILRISYTITIKSISTTLNIICK